MSPDARRSLSILAGLVLFLGSLVLVVTAVLDWRATGQDIVTAESRENLPPAADPARYLIAGSSRAEATADLQGRLSEAARDAGIGLPGSVRFGQENPDNPLQITIDVTAEGDIEGLARFLHALESRLPALIVTRARLIAGDTDSQLRLEVRIEARRAPGGGS